MEVVELKRRGRPPAMSLEERRRQIVAAAEETFTSKGYAAASMDDVVLACGMSKRTVYEMFDTKGRLFHDVVVSSLENAPRLDLNGGVQPSEGLMPLRDVLREMAAFILSPRQVALTRLVLTESHATPELGAIFYETAVVRGQDILTETIQRLGVPNPPGRHRPDELADLLVGTLIGPQHFSALLGRTATPTQAEIHARIDWLLEILAPALGLGTDAGSAEPNACS